MDDIARFEAAWHAFAAACADTVAPEATYQAWFSHFLMEEFEPLRVVREVDFGSRHLADQDQRRFTGSKLMLDVMVLREPEVALPRRSTLGPRNSEVTPNPRSGLARLGQFSVVSELKVGSTQEHGLTYGAVVRDFHKLDAILWQAQIDYPENPLPSAVVCILDNNRHHRLNRAHLQQRLASDPPRLPIHTLVYSAQSH